MNYYNPYFYSNPAMSMTGTSLLTRLFGNFSFSKLLNGTQKALNFANQAIPFVKQVKPIIGNAKTMFKVMNEFKKSEKPISKNNSTVTNSGFLNSTNKTNYSNGPTFFM